MTMIPAHLHYIWFGGRPLTDRVARTIDRWRELMPDFRITEWNEQNMDVQEHPWMGRMHREQQWAFASDVARLLILRRHGGIYLDTDMEIRRPLTPFLRQSAFWCFEYDTFLSTAIIGCRMEHPLLSALLEEYDRLEHPVVNNNLVTRHFIRAFPTFHLNGREQRVGGDVHIYPKEYFILPTWDRTKGYAIHRADNHWKGNAHGGASIARMIRAVIGDVLYFKLLNLRMMYQDTFREEARALRER